MPVNLGPKLKVGNQENRRMASLLSCAASLGLLRPFQCMHHRQTAYCTLRFAKDLQGTLSVNDNLGNIRWGHYFVLADRPFLASTKSVKLYRAEYVIRGIMERRIRTSPVCVGVCMTQFFSCKCRACFPCTIPSPPPFPPSRCPTAAYTTIITTRAEVSTESHHTLTFVIIPSCVD